LTFSAQRSVAPPPGVVLPRNGGDPHIQGSGAGSAGRRGAVIVFVDETGFSFQVEPGTTWAPKTVKHNPFSRLENSRKASSSGGIVRRSKGRTPVLRRISKRRQVSTAIGLTISGHVYKKHFDRVIHGEDTIEHLQHLRSQIGGPMVLVWDRLQAHRSEVVKAFLAEHPEIVVEWLPGYVPDLNPEEDGHGNVKDRMKGGTPETEAEIREEQKLPNAGRPLPQAVSRRE
jgi:transposase